MWVNLAYCRHIKKLVYNPYGRFLYLLYSGWSGKKRDKNWRSKEANTLGPFIFRRYIAGRQVTTHHLVCELSLVFYLISASKSQSEPLGNPDEVVGIQVTEDFCFRPHLELSTLIDDNIFIQRENPISDLIQSVTPGLELQWGLPTLDDSLYAALDYTLRQEIFLNHSEQNSLDQDSKLLVHYRFTKLVLEASHESRSVTAANIDAGGRVNLTTERTSAAAKYRWSPKTSFEIDLNQEANDYENLTDFRERRIQSSMNYAIDPKVTGSLEYDVGFVNAHQQPDQNFQQLSGRVGYEINPSFNLSARMGFEFRKMQNTDSTARPAFDVQMHYNWQRRLNVILNAYQRTQTSVWSTGGYYTSWGGGGTLSCQILSRLALSLNANWNDSTYEMNSNPITSRQDQYFSVKPEVRYALDEYCYLAFSHEYIKNISTARAREFGNNRTTISLNFNY
jgi:hypothetical protein